MEKKKQIGIIIGLIKSQLIINKDKNQIHPKEIKQKNKKMILHYKNKKNKI